MSGSREFAPGESVWTPSGDAVINGSTLVWEGIGAGGVGANNPGGINTGGGGGGGGSYAKVTVVVADVTVQWSMQIDAGGAGSTYVDNPSAVRILTAGSGSDAVNETGGNPGEATVGDVLRQGGLGGTSLGLGGGGGGGAAGDSASGNAGTNGGASGGAGGSNVTQLGVSGGGGGAGGNNGADGNDGTQYGGGGGGTGDNGTTPGNGYAGRLRVTWTDPVGTAGNQGWFGLLE